ncbi:MAG: polyphosphate--glucose phosphotransferase [Ilumatobacteraceae bacterium]
MTDTAQRIALGVDVGGTGIKAAPVDLADGRLVGDRLRIDTPRPATPDRVVDVVRQLVAAHHWTGSVGVCVPAVVQRGVVRTAANIDPAWVDCDAGRLLSDRLDRRVPVVNDADAAGIAEMTWGAGRGRAGVVLCVTFGTGIGSGLFVDGRLVPNTELGHVELDGLDAETRAAARAREREDLSWREWAERVDRYLGHLHGLFWPELIIVGGGVSKKADRWLPYLEPGCEVVAAELVNNAGIAGAALLGSMSED